jgi:hypothetical protein
VTVPPNTTAELKLPAGATKGTTLAAGAHHFAFPRALVK